MEGEGRLQHRAPRIRQDIIDLVRRGRESNVINKLPERQQDVLNLRYPEDGDCLTQEAVSARLYGITHARGSKGVVSQTERRGINNLKQLLSPQ